jgi:hypothetical protein
VLRLAITVADHIRHAVMTKELMKRSTVEQLALHLRNRPGSRRRRRLASRLRSSIKFANTPPRLSAPCRA